MLDPVDKQWLLRLALKLLKAVGEIVSSESPRAMAAACIESIEKDYPGIIQKGGV
jgi:hypothetical protein